MIPEIGHFCLVLALVLALCQAIAPLVGVSQNNVALMKLAKYCSVGQFSFVLLSFACLTYAFVSNDFSVKYVALNSNTLLPMQYKFSAVWGGHEGSLLLWILILSGWGCAVALKSRLLPLEMLARVLAVMGFVAVGFLLFILLTSNPFDRTFPVIPVDGRDLNPLLQDFGLIVHPPMLYMGYVGFSVAFAFAIAGLLSGNIDNAWARWSRPWTTVAWCFLTLGIALGSWWAYYELGWGGWWFWDPVENASFMPWLAGTALLHSLAMTEKRSIFKSWTLLLAISTFSLSLLGTFLVRSGIITSVHAFASDPTRGIFILAFLGVVVGASLILFALRAHTLQSDNSWKLFSRETFIMGNNLLLVVATLVVFSGTLFPLFAEAMNWGQLSVGEPYYNLVFSPLILCIATILPLGYSLYWKKHDYTAVKWRVWITCGLLGIISGYYQLRWLDGVHYQFHWLDVCIVSAILAGRYVVGRRQMVSVQFDCLMWLGLGMYLSYCLAELHLIATVLVFALLVWGIGSIAQDVWQKKFSGAKTIKLQRSYIGMQCAHLGVYVAIAGAAIATMYSIERDVRMAPNDPVYIHNYRFVLESVQHYEGPNYISDKGTVHVTKTAISLEDWFDRALDVSGWETPFTEVATLHPEKRSYLMQKSMPMTEASIDAGFIRDVYVSLGGSLEDGSWSVRLYYKPFVRWIWLGAILMALGGVIAITDKRYRMRLKQKLGA